MQRARVACSRDTGRYDRYFFCCGWWCSFFCLWRCFCSWALLWFDASSMAGVDGCGIWGVLEREPPCPRCCDIVFSFTRPLVKLSEMLITLIVAFRQLTSDASSFNSRGPYVPQKLTQRETNCTNVQRSAPAQYQHRCCPLVGTRPIPFCLMRSDRRGVAWAWFAGQPALTLHKTTLHPLPPPLVVGMLMLLCPSSSPMILAARPLSSVFINLPCVTVLSNKIRGPRDFVF